MKDLLVNKWTWITVVRSEEQQFNKPLRVWGVLSKLTFEKEGMKWFHNYLLQFNVWGLGRGLFKLWTVWINVQFYSFSNKSIYGVKYFQYSVKVFLN